MIERTLIIVKPDGVSRGLIGEVIGRFEQKGFKLVAGRFMRIGDELAGQHYAEHKEKPFFPALVGFITSAPVLVMVFEGNRIVEAARRMLGKTNGIEADPGSIRGTYGSSRVFNVVHASDSPESSVREIGLYFSKDEIFDYSLPTEPYLYEKGE
ncbi:MAG: nucleoside-diphosphate kinase [Planctomycetes bacterium]|nr:nucleoside-diphosphate kinase [Planctomycetota bacterium]